MASCPICNGPLVPTGITSVDRQFGHPGEFSVSECVECRLGVTQPSLSDDEIGVYYAGGYGEFGISRSRLRARFRARRLGREPFSALRGPGRLLDVGCAAGQIGAELMARGWQVSGVEPDGEAVSHARRLGLDARQGDLTLFEDDTQGFDAVLFHHSLEHVADPVDALRRARALVAPRSGQVAVAVPNWESPLRRRFGGAWFQLDVPRHRWHFSRHALSRAANAAGMTVAAAGATPAIESYLGSVQYRAWGRRRIQGKAFFLAMLALLPLETRLAPAETAYVIAVPASPAGTS